MKKAILKRIGMFMIIGALISSCAGEQGEPGPVGEQGAQGDKGDAGNDGSDGENGIDGVVKSGFFEGTISGKRTDETAFTYDFKFDRRPNELEQDNSGYLGTDTEGFVYNQYCDCHQLSLVRQDSAIGGNLPSELRMRLLLKNRGTANEKLELEYGFGYDFKIFFLKELPATSIFRVEAGGFFYMDNFSPISDAENSIFNIVHDERVQVYPTEHNGVSYSALRTTDDKLLLFEEIQNSSKSTSEFKYLLDNYGDEISNVSPYDQLRLDNISLTGRYYYGLSKNVNGSYAPLWSLTTVWEDAMEITNYHYDSNTGHLTFEFDMIIKGDSFYNSTKHDLSIKGKFDSGEGKVYKDVVARKGN